MFKKLTKKLTGRHREPEFDVLERADLIADTRGTLIVRPQTATLGVGDLQQVAKRLAETGCEVFQTICFDFSRVEQMVGPWGAHFAILIGLAHGVRAKVGLTGLQDQPRAIAHLFRHSAELRALVTEGSVPSKQADQAAKGRKAA